ncbi:MAG: AbrB/MazE/SpoVT family DNA-binding domain-containing protein [Gammaproteobacteria bacterium]|nr:AbrB/MazE/SpoVT family DNA-binding domain-containing protein [Gammaproteobacteria bacterium]
MVAVVKLRKIGNSLGVILPKEELERLHVSDGDELYAIPTSGGLEISPYDPGFDGKLRAFERTRRKYRNALRELAK